MAHEGDLVAERALRERDIEHLVVHADGLIVGVADRIRLAGGHRVGHKAHVDLVGIARAGDPLDRDGFAGNGQRGLRVHREAAVVGLVEIGVGVAVEIVHAVGVIARVKRTAKARDVQEEILVLVPAAVGKADDNGDGCPLLVRGDAEREGRLQAVHAAGNGGGLVLIAAAAEIELHRGLSGVDAGHFAGDGAVDRIADERGGGGADLEARLVEAAGGDHLHFGIGDLRAGVAVSVRGDGDHEVFGGIPAAVRLSEGDGHGRAAVGRGQLKLEHPAAAAARRALHIGGLERIVLGAEVQLVERGVGGLEADEKLLARDDHAGLRGGEHLEFRVVLGLQNLDAGFLQIVGQLRDRGRGLRLLIRVLARVGAFGDIGGDDELKLTGVIGALRGEIALEDADRDTRSGSARGQREVV